MPASGLALASSPLGLMLSGPVAGRLALSVAPRRLALIGASLMALAQICIGTADAPANIPVLAASMFAQGVGLGLFQVACFDISTATIPREARGVAGSLVMMTRTVGVVTAATVLMLIFQTVRTSAADAGTPDGLAFLAGFHAAFRMATFLSILVVLAGVWRGWARGAPTRSTSLRGSGAADAGVQARRTSLAATAGSPLPGQGGAPRIFTAQSARCALRCPVTTINPYASSRAAS